MCRRRLFFPPPKVDSAVLLIEVFPDEAQPYPGVEPVRFFDLVRAGFSQKRKQLANSLTAGLSPTLDKSGVQSVLAQAAIDGSQRAESLTLAEWVSLYHILNA